ncbi:MAG: AMP-binding protein [Bacteroidota bacterium]|nr:AMP-binding protein [Candidatus Kapabacteria bacterium]MDW8218920.1 AMP-binding protein [Bacteroidota bacterium]
MVQEVEKIWLKSYPKGVPEHINPDRFPSLLEFMDDCLQQYGDRPGYENLGVVLTYNEVHRLALQFAAFLQKRGFKKGDRIAVQMPNLIQYAVVVMGALRAGLTVVNTNPLYTPQEMRHQFNDSGATAIVIVENFAANLQSILAETQIHTVIITEVADMVPGIKGWLMNAAIKYIKKMVPPYDIPNAIMLKDALNEGAKAQYTKPDIKSNDLAFLQYTGGTTGVSKGAMLTHRNILSNMEMLVAWMFPKLKNPGEEIIITALPLYHIFALTFNFFGPMRYGAKNVLITNPRDMDAFVEELKKHKFTVISGVNTLFNGLLNHPEFTKCDFSRLNITLGGGMAVQDAVAEKWEKVTGCVLYEAYGLTETSPGLTVNPMDGTHRRGYIGLPLPSTEIGIFNDNNEMVPIGERGEIWARGPQIMLGYWQRPEETANVMHNGWFKTGDIGVMDEDGFIKIVDRKKEMILVSGFNVYPNEVENVIAMHPKVLEVGVIGVPDEKSHEAVKAFIVKKDPSLTAEEIKEFCKQHLTGYKVPKHVEFRNELPKSNVGKILRRLLRE